MNTTEQIRPNPQATIDNLGLKLSSVFVPFSQSRNKGEKHPSLNWNVTLYTLSPLDGQRRNILTTDYMAGSAHAPSYKQSDNTQFTHNKVVAECESGRASATGKPILPNTLDIIYSLVMDSSVLDSGDFEEWAFELGYDTDSRAAEKIYQACLDIALKLRRGVGEHGLEELRTAFQDY
jgi:hypothetical protein